MLAFEFTGLPCMNRGVSFFDPYYNFVSTPQSPIQCCTTGQVVFGQQTVGEGGVSDLILSQTPLSTKVSQQFCRPL